ncbi:MAG TPA: VCBS domain-containing protein, partial [Microvirga sp.]
MATQTLYYGGTGTDPLIRITISDASGGAFTVKVEQVQATDGDASRDPDGKFYLGDLRGFFIDFASPIKAATVSGYSAHSGYDVPATVAQTTSLVAGKTVAYGTNVTSVGGSDNNMSGATKTGYDIGMEIGSAGIGKDDIGAISFTLNKTGLTLDELVKSTTFGVRITSVAQDVNKDGDVTDAGESRSLSSKIASPAPPPPNSNPVAVVDAGSVKEDQGPIAGNVLENDTDANTDTLSVSGVTHAGAVDNGTTITVKGAYGTLVITKATGAYTYTLDNSSATVQGLREGDVKKEVFSYSISDGRGGSGGSTLTIDVIGVNDAAVLTSATKELTEGNTAAALSTSGTLPISDVDSAETFQAQTDT